MINVLFYLIAGHLVADYFDYSVFCLNRRTSL